MVLWQTARERVGRIGKMLLFQLDRILCTQELVTMQDTRQIRGQSYGNWNGSWYYL